MERKTKLSPLAEQAFLGEQAFQKLTDIFFSLRQNIELPYLNQKSILLEDRTIIRGTDYKTENWFKFEVRGDKDFIEFQAGKDGLWLIKIPIKINFKFIDDLEYGSLHSETIDFRGNPRKGEQSQKMADWVSKMINKNKFTPPPFSVKANY